MEHWNCYGFGNGGPSANGVANGLEVLEAAPCAGDTDLGIIVGGDDISDVVPDVEGGWMEGAKSPIRAAIAPTIADTAAIFVHPRVLTMKRTPVKSSQVKSIGYDESEKMLHVEFQPRKTETEGQIYEYANIPSGLYADLMKAESKGAFLGKYILRNKTHPFKRIP